MPWITRLVLHERIVVVKFFAVQIGGAEQRVVHGFLVEIGVLGVVIGEVHFVLEENQAATGAGFAVGLVAQGKVCAKTLGGFAAANAAGEVIFFIDEIIPERHHGALIIHVVGFCGDIGHAREEIGRANGVAHGFVFLLHGHAALIVIGAVAAAIEQEFCEGDVAVAVPAALDIVHETAKAHERLLHFLVAVVPFFFPWADVGHPAVGEFFSGVIETLVRAAGERVMIDGGLNKITPHIALVIAAMRGVPAPGPLSAVGERVGGLQIAVRLLRGENFWDPIFKRRLHFRLRGDDFRIALRVHHERDAHGLDRLVHPGIGKNKPPLRSVWLAAQGLGGLDKIIYAAVAVIGGDVGAVDFVNAVRNPVHNQRLGLGAPKRIVDFIGLGVNDVQALRRRRSGDFHVQGGRRAQPALAGGQFQHVVAGLGKGGGGDVGMHVGKFNFAGAGVLAPGDLGRFARF